MWHQYLTLTSFDITTEQGRSAERYRRAAWSILANIVSKGMAMLVMVLGVSLTIPYLGAERFGVWMTIASFAGMLTFLDLGVGNALTNHVAERAARGDPVSLKRTISGGLGFLLLIGAAVGCVLWTLSAWLPWERLIKVRNLTLYAEMRQAAMLFAVLFGFNLFTNSIQKVYVGLQRAFEGHLTAALGSGIAIVGLWLAARQHADIPTLLAVTLGSQSVVAIFLLILLIRRGQFSIIGIRDAVRCESPRLVHIGGLFFLLQIGAMVGWGIDGLIISSTLGAAQVAIYSVAQRLFQFVSQPLAMMNAPLWGAYADAHVQGDRAFIFHTLRTSMLMTLALAASGVLALLFSSEWLISYWTNNQVEVPFLFALAFAGWVILEAVGNAFGIFLNGCNIIRQQVIVVCMFTVVVIPLKVFAVSRYGIVALPIATSAAYLLTTVGLYSTLFRPSVLKKLPTHIKEAAK